MTVVFPPHNSWLCNLEEVTSQRWTSLFLLGEIQGGEISRFPAGHDICDEGKHEERTLTTALQI